MQAHKANLRHLDIDVVVFQNIRLDQNWHSENARNYFTRIYMVHNGSGKLYTNNGTITMRPGNIYLIPSEYDFGFSCESMEKVFFHVLMPFGEKTDMLSEIQRILILPDRLDTINTLYNLCEATDVVSLFKVKTILYSVLQDFISQYDLHFSDKLNLSPITQNALAYIWENTSVKLTAKDIADHLFVSESKLRNVFKEEVNVTIGAYIDDAIFFTVRKMLSSGYSIEQIANALEFCDRNYLSRRFKEKTGKTLSQYRQELFIQKPRS